MVRTLGLLAAGLGAGVGLSAQQTDQPVAHVTSYQVPSARLDSLRVLLRAYPQWVVKARELGRVLDWQVWIHRYGDEWNVAVVHIFPSWKAFTDQNPDWGGDVFRLVEPDSTKRAAFNAAWSWVFQGTTHRDQIYDVPKQ